MQHAKFRGNRPPVPEKILEDSATRLYDLRIPNKTPIANAYAIYEPGS